MYNMFKRSCLRLAICAASGGKQFCRRAVEWPFSHRSSITGFDRTCSAQHPSAALVLPLDQGSPLATRWWTARSTNQRRYLPHLTEPWRLIGCQGRSPVIPSPSAVSRGGTTPGGERRDGLMKTSHWTTKTKEPLAGNDPLTVKVDAEKVQFVLKSH